MRGVTWRHCISPSIKKKKSRDLAYTFCNARFKGATLHVCLYLWVVDGDIAYTCMLDYVIIQKKFIVLFVSVFFHELIQKLIDQR